MIFTAFLCGLYAHLNNSGWFEPWKPLGKPPEKAVKISYYEGNVKDYLPFVETTDGIVYFYSNSLSNNQKNYWVKTDFSELPIKKTYPCYKVDPFDVPKPPGKVIDMVEFESCWVGLAVISATTTQHNFVLLEDGSVWAWEYSHPIPIFAFFSVVVHTIIGAALGLLVGVAGVIITGYRNSHKVDTA